jgi:hypothetical protein
MGLRTTVALKETPSASGEKTAKGDAISKTAAHRIVGNNEAIALPITGFGKNVMPLAGAGATRECGLKTRQSIIKKDTTGDDGLGHVRKKIPRSPFRLTVQFRIVVETPGGTPTP